MRQSADAAKQQSTRPWTVTFEIFSGWAARSARREEAELAIKARGDELRVDRREAHVRDDVVVPCATVPKLLLHGRLTRRLLTLPTHESESARAYIHSTLLESNTHDTAMDRGERVLASGRACDAVRNAAAPHIHDETSKVR